MQRCVLGKALQKVGQIQPVHAGAFQNVCCSLHFPQTNSRRVSYSFHPSALVIPQTDCSGRRESNNSRMLPFLLDCSQNGLQQTKGRPVKKSLRCWLLEKTSHQDTHKKSIRKDLRGFGRSTNIAAVAIFTFVYYF